MKLFFLGIYNCHVFSFCVLCIYHQFNPEFFVSCLSLFRYIKYSIDSIFPRSFSLLHSGLVPTLFAAQLIWGMENRVNFPLPLFQGFLFSSFVLALLLVSPLFTFLDLVEPSISFLEVYRKLSFLLHFQK